METTNALMAHLFEFCNRFTVKEVRCKVTKMGPHNPKTNAIHDSVDRRLFTVRRRAAKCLDMDLDCSRIYGRYDTGAKFSIATHKLPQALGL